jgi:hypothetical protein
MENQPGEKIFPTRPPDRRICRIGETFGKSGHSGRAKKRQIIGTDRLGVFAMLRFVDHHPTASLWLIAAAQGLAMLGLNVALRALVL